MLAAPTSRMARSESISRAAEHLGLSQPAVSNALARLRQAWTELGSTLREIRRYRPLLWFLAAYILYIDGVNTIIKMAVDYGVAIGLPASALIQALLLTQFVAFPASLWTATMRLPCTRRCVTRSMRNTGNHSCSL